MTRLALLSDVHANWPALQAVLEVVAERGVDDVLVAGDLIGYGGQPNECVATLAEIGARCVSGNHELLLFDRLPAERFAPRAQQSMEVTRRLISAETSAWLAALPGTLRVGDVLMTHGSLDSPDEYVRTEARALELLDRLPREAPGANTLVLGHTHQQWCVVAGQGVVPLGRSVDHGDGRRLLNPGSSGQSRQRERRPRARFAIYDTAAGRVEFLRVDYDVAASLEVLRGLGLPDRCLHAPPRLRVRAASVIRNLGRRSP